MLHGIKISLRLCLLAALMATLLPAAFAADENPLYMRYVQKGEESIEKNNYSDAIAWFEEAMSLEPSNPQNVMLLSNVGMLHFYQGEDSLALHKLSEARAIAPASVVILNNRTRVLTAMNRIDDALADYAIIERLDSTYTPAIYDRATLLMRKGELDKALESALRCDSLKPDEPQTSLLLAVIYSNMNRPQEAIEYYTKMIKTSPEAVYYSARAMCHLVLEELPEAADDIASGLELDPHDPELYYCRAYLNHLRFRDEDARADLDSAMRLGLDPDRARALMQGFN